MKTLLFLFVACTLLFSCAEIKPAIRVKFVNLTGKTLTHVQTTKGSIGTLMPQATSKEVRFQELKSMTHPQLEIKFSAEIDGQKYIQLPEHLLFDPMSASQSPGKYLCEIRLSTTPTQINGFFIKWVKQS
ncbi:hypothetical protein [Larkinella humicola]|uniref:Ig-like domain-containing protein n=1 Tax=Larkinella humicola TaxID=2607654 RepID=A0A5N1JD18_9BACT|nr:hypothetical protein [Larkinella humicola]KAA9352827.1 hypothetical protein F0P93_16710 [Larkinella humicola]